MYQLDQTPALGLLAHLTCLPTQIKVQHSAHVPAPHSEAWGWGWEWGREWGRKEQTGGDTEQLRFHLGCPLPQPEESQGERAVGYMIYFHLNMEGKSHTPPSPSQGECTLNSTPFSVHPVGRGNSADPVLLPSLLPRRGFSQGDKGRSRTRHRSEALERGERGREEQHQRPGESGKGHSFFVFFKNSIIWETVVIHFQNTLQSPTFHTAPLLTALWFFRQN